MSTGPDTRAAFDLLWRADVTGETIDALPDDVRPTTRAEAYAVQAHWAEVTAGVPGWKIAATSVAGQQHVNVDGPLAGRVLAERVFEPGRVSLAGNVMRLAELEFAFRLDHDFLPRAEAYAEADVLDGAGELLLSWELPSSRFTDPAAAGEVQLIADNACGHSLVLAPAAAQDWKSLDLAAVRVTGSSSNGTVLEGAGDRVLGSPLTALTWLVNELSTHGIPLHAGQFVTTGVCTQPMLVAPGETIVGDYGRFGTLELTFVP
ncbi:2-keto-4-pentenoate hydratase [Mariniluteicoccus flavus]